MINQIVTGWTTKYANRTNIKVALVGIPSDDGARDKQVYVMLPLSDIPTFVAEITRHAYVAPNGSEPSLDAIKNIINIDINNNKKKGLVTKTS